jgi:hypothetical protein
MDLRVREPIIAESLKLIAGVLFCCFPLALVALMLWPKAEEQGTTAQLNQLLIYEITTGEGLSLLGSPSLPRLERSAAVDVANSSSTT